MSKSQPDDSTEPAQTADTAAAGKEEEDDNLTAADELAPLQVVCLTHLPVLLSIIIIIS